MTTTTSTTATTTPTPTSATSTALTQNGTDYNMFLKLLTTQMQNQDPLKPMDSTEYTQQLAQFSQVEQTIQQTSKLDQILSQLTTQNMAQATGFIGHAAQFESATSGLSAKAPASWSYSAASPIASMTATITDSTGKTVATKAIDSTDQSGSFSWDGTLASGAQAPAGAYNLAIAGVDLNGAAVAVKIASTGTVSEVVGGNGAVTLGVNGVQMPIASLIKLTDISGS